MRHLLRRRNLLIAGAVIALAASGSFVWVSRAQSTPQYRTTNATIGTVTQTISLSGNLAPATESDVDFTSTGKVSAVPVHVGDQVATGQTLATLDDASLQNALTTAQANLSSAEAKLSLDQAGPTAQNLASARGQVASAQVSLTNAQQALKDTDAANRQQETNDGCATDGSTATSQCQQDYQKAQQSHDQAQAAVNTAQVQLSNAQASLGALLQGSTPQQVQMDQASVSVAQVAVDNAQTALTDATLTSPIDGVVAQVNVSVGQSVSGGSGGSSSSSASTPHAFVIIDPGAFQVTGSVSDASINEIAVGQKARVTPAGSSQAVTGKVTVVAPEATVSSGVATFAVTVSVDGNQPSFHAGASAQVQVIINQVVGVLTVPTGAVHNSAGGTTVQVLVSGQVQDRPVTVGAIDAQRTQIIDGITTTDVIVLATVSSTVPASTSGNGGGLFPGGGGGGRAAGGGGGGRAGGG